MPALCLVPPSPAAAIGALQRDPWRIAAVVLGFIAWWPIGLALLLFLKGSTLMGCMSRWMNRADRPWPAMTGSGTGNSAFDEYRDGVLRRLEEERQKLEEDRQAFSGFLDQLKRAKDREEFDRFMAHRNAPGPEGA